MLSTNPFGVLANGIPHPPRAFPKRKNKKKSRANTASDETPLKENSFDAVDDQRVIVYHETKKNKEEKEGEETLEPQMNSEKADISNTKEIKKKKANKHRNRGKKTGPKAVSEPVQHGKHDCQQPGSDKPTAAIVEDAQANHVDVAVVMASQVDNSPVTTAVEVEKPDCKQLVLAPAGSTELLSAGEHVSIEDRSMNLLGEAKSSDDDIHKPDILEDVSVVDSETMNSVKSPVIYVQEKKFGERKMSMSNIYAILGNGAESMSDDESVPCEDIEITRSKKKKNSKRNAIRNKNRKMHLKAAKTANSTKLRGLGSLNIVFAGVAVVFSAAIIIWVPSIVCLICRSCKGDGQHFRL
ncbi:hypothetical protein N0V90_002895 [Kalmusia sp. IMI 367209]|nr:hypothetical protein N0V90_002895 [Kalmusia sp. IMI 367209]